jgi:small subunit ribosomal protein S6
VQFTYETVFITAPTLTEDEEKSIVGGLAQIVDDGGGAMVANERLGRRRLAYTIGKFDDGVYTRFLYDSEAAVPKELERRFRISDKVIRYLTVRLETDWAADAKVQAVRDAEARAAAEAARAAAPEGAAEPAAVIDPFDRPRHRSGREEEDDDRGEPWGGEPGGGMA